VELIPFSGAFSRGGLHSLNLAYDIMSAGWPVQLTASAFNRLGQYVSSPGNRAYCYATSLAMAVTIVLTGPTERDGQAELSWVVD